MHGLAGEAVTAERNALLIENQALRAALQDLLDEQNGPPLERHRETWQKAVDTAQILLNATSFAAETM